MKLTNLLKTKKLGYFSQPVSDRPVYRVIERIKPFSIVELGVGDAVRAERMLDLARRHCTDRIQYTGIGEFEAKPDGQLSLKETYQRLSTMPASVRLIPGNAFGALKSHANNLTGTDLLVIAHEQTGTPLQAAWYLVPRMLHNESLVLIQEAPDSDFVELSFQDVQQRVDQHRSARAA